MASATLRAGEQDPAFPTWRTGFDSKVYAVAVQPDGKTLVGGSFARLHGWTGSPGLVRLNADGSLDTTFNAACTSSCGFVGVVSALAVQSNGKIIVGGGFTTYNGSAVNRIARLNTDGSLDTTFNAASTVGFNSSVNAVALQADGKIIAGGGFTTYRNSAANYIVRLNADGSLDTTFNSA